MKNTVFWYVILFLIVLISSVLLKKINQTNVNNLQLSNDNYKFEICLIYVSSSECSYCNDPDLITTVYNLKSYLSLFGKENSLNFKSIAVGVESNVEKSLQHFSESGFYHEYSVGSGWDNSLALKYIKDEYKGDQITPQVVIFLREFDVVKNTNRNIFNKGLIREKEILRVSGSTNIKNWEKNGFPLPNVSEFTMR
jgi:hypothetical protein